MKRRTDQIEALLAENRTIREKMLRMQQKIEANDKRIANLKATPEYKQEQRAAKFRSTVDERLRRCLVMNGKIANE